MLIERRALGPFRIHERRPKPRGFTKYVVTKNDDRDINKQFGRYSAAVRWCKTQLPKPTPHIVIDLDDKSGVATLPVSYTILDGEFTHTAHAKVDPDKVEGILGIIPTK